MNDITKKQLLKYSRSYIENLFDSKNLVDSSFWDKIELHHKGVYISGVYESQNHKIGFMKENTVSLKDSFDLSLNMMYDYFMANKISNSNFKLLKIFITIITDVIYIQDPMKWDDKKDGVYFQWGQKYKAFYLPYEIYTMNMDKVQILNYLCSTVAKVPANLWRMPEGLVFKITCNSFSDGH